ncbi:MAG: caspase family protein [Myxococcota bacterium]
MWGVLWTLAAHAAAPVGGELSDRAAVVVGSNRPMPGTAPLRYAHDDARAVERTLIDVGGFQPSEVVRLLDPSADEVRQALTRFGDRKTLWFYYSGHADAAALYPAGERLPLADVRAELSRHEDGVRIGVVDACGGGGWTNTKCFVAEPPGFAIPDPPAGEGHAWIASTSGSQKAHEVASLGGSLFTHHFVSGLRGAADTSGEGTITLNEAFEYAKARTTEDAATQIQALQTPSFQVDFRGRRDMVLTDLEHAPARMRIVQDQGPIQVVSLQTGLVLLELDKGPRNVQLALPPGRYAVRVVEGDALRSKTLVLRAGDAVVVAEGDLVAGPALALNAKGPQRRIPYDEGMLDRGMVEVALRTSDHQLHNGILDVTVAFLPRLTVRLMPVLERFHVSWAVSDRVQVSLPGWVTWRVNRGASAETLVWGGAKRLAYLGNQIEGVDPDEVYVSRDWAVSPELGVLRRWPLDEVRTLDLSVFARTDLVYRGTGSGTWIPGAGQTPRGWREGAVNLTGQFVLQRRLGRFVTLNLGVAVFTGLAYDPPSVRDDLESSFFREQPYVGLGTPYQRAGRFAPLVALHMTRDLHLGLDPGLGVLVGDLPNTRRPLWMSLGAGFRMLYITPTALLSFTR